jgi:membrane protein DedA with SNARE-associated domain
VDWWTSLGAAVGRFLEQHGLLAAFVLIAVEEAGVPSPLPADLLVLLGAALARDGRVVLWQLVAVAEAATILGASILYLLARRAGRDLVLRYGQHVRLGPDRLERVGARLRRGGVWAVALGRVAPGMRILTAVACGVFEVPHRVFLPGLALGALAYILIFALRGYVFGPPIVAVVERINLPLSAVLSLLLLAVVAVWLLRARRGPAAPAEAGAVARARAGLRAGALAAVCAALAFNVLVGLVGGLSDLAPRWR